MLKVGFNRHFHQLRFATTALVLLIAGFFPVVNASAQSIDSSPVEDGVYGDLYIYNISASGGIGDLAITLETPLPGITLSDNGNGTAILSGSPTQAGTFPVTIRVTDTFFPIFTSTQDYDLVIKKAVLQAKADDQSRFYGYNDPIFTIDYTGFKFSDDASALTDAPIGDPDADDNSTPGDYDINLTGGLDDDHYTFSFQSGTLTIDPAPVTITAEDKTKEYGDNNPGFTVVYSALQNGQTSLPGITANAVGVVNNTVAGDHPITINGTSANYAITKVPGTLTITAAPVTITAVAKSKDYGDANPAFTFTYSGLKNGETSIPGITGDVGSVNNLTGVGDYPIAVAGTSTNYDITRVSGILTIDAADVTITAVNKSKEYGDANPAFTFTYVGLKNGETSIPGIAGDVGAVNASTGVGGYPIAVAGTSTNYNITRVSGTLTVDAADVTITAVSKAKEYGDANPAFTFTYSGLKNGETSIPGITGDVGAVNASTGVGGYPIAVAGTSTNYNITRVSGTLTIDAADVTITAVNKSKEYGDANPAFTFTYIGLKNGETSIPGITGDVGSVNASTGAGGYPIAVAGTSTNYNITRVSGTLTINAAAVTITAVNKSKEYGDANPAFTFTYSGLKNGETSIPGITGDVGSVNNLTGVGGYPIAVAGTSTNYNITRVSGTLTINAAAVTITAVNKSKEYGDANPAFTFTYIGLKNGETSITGITGDVGSVNASTGAGGYPIAVAGTSTNYNITRVSGTLTINAAAVTITAVNKSKEYGDANPAFTFTYSGLKNGETSIPGITGDVGSVNASTGAGGYPIAVAGTSTNYNITRVSGTLTINAAAVTITAVNKSKNYGDVNPVFTFTYIGLKNGETSITGITGDVGSVNASTGAGGYPIAVAGTSTNYNITRVSGTLTINAADVTITAVNKSREYGDANPVFTFTYSGLKNGETSIPGITGDVGSVNASTGVGGYPIAVAGTSTNYNITRVSGTLTINAAALTIAAVNKSKNYGDLNPPFTVTYTGLKNGQTSLPGVEADADGVGQFAAVGNHTIAVTGGASTNYSITRTSGTLTINAAGLTIAAVNKAKNYGDPNPTYTVTYTGFKNGETSLPGVEAKTTGVDENTGAGGYTIAVTGGTSTNYAITRTSGTLTINAVPLTITAVDKSKRYGDTNPLFTVTYTGLKNGQTSLPGVVASVAPGVDHTAIPALYPISVTGGTSTNYNITRVSGTLTIGRATLTVTADNKTRPFGAPNPLPTISYSGFKNGHSETTLTTAPNSKPTAIIAANNLTNAGNADINVSGGSHPFYDFEYVKGILSITKVTLTVQANAKSYVYGLVSVSDLTFTYIGFVNGNNASVINDPPDITTDATVLSHVGPYDIELSGGEDDNYDLALVNNTLEVTRAPLTITAQNQIRSYGAANLPLTVSYVGFQHTDGPNVFTAPLKVTTSATKNSHVGAYGIIPSNAAADDYTINFVQGTLTITKAELTIRPVDTSRPYGSPNPLTFALSYTGFLNNDDAGDITPPTGSAPTALITSNVGTYTIELNGGAAGDYTFEFDDGVLTITKAVLQVVVDSHSRPYGSPNPSNLTMVITGFKNSQNTTVIDQLPSVSTDANVNSEVDQYDIEATGGLDNNYTFNYQKGKLTVTQVTLTATAQPASTTYGTIPESFDIVYTGFVLGENAGVIDTKPTGSTTATVTSSPGTAPISVINGEDNNYDFNSVGSTLTITKAPLKAIADDVGRINELPNPELTITYEGLMNGESPDVLDTRPTAETVATVSSPPGEYPITVSGGNDNHYDFTYQDGTFLIVLDSPPIPNPFEIETNEDTAFPFDVALFQANTTDDPGGKISFITILTLPTKGVLYKEQGAPVVAGNEILVTNGTLGTLFYLPNSNSNGTDSFTWSVNDGVFASETSSTVTIVIKPINDAPVLSNIEEAKVEYNPGDESVLLTESLTISDTDDEFIFGATVSITTSTFATGDELTLTAPSNSVVEITYDETKGEMQLTGKDTRASYQDLLRSITFNSPVDGAAIIGDKLINFVVKDSVLNSNIATRTVLIEQVFPELDIVNAFTPNDDGINDVWDVLNLKTYSDIDIRVFDSRGIQVFGCTDKICEWDGKFKEKPLPAGPYLYSINLDNGRRKYNGVVTILK